MKTQRWILLGVLSALIALPALATDDTRPSAKIRVRGEVIAVEHRPDGSGVMQTHLRIRTRAQEEQTLHLGSQAEWGETFQVGDQVRARYRYGETDGGGQMLRIRNQNTGETLQGQGDGTMTRVRERTRVRSDQGLSAGAGAGGARRGGGGGGGRGGR